MRLSLSPHTAFQIGSNGIQLVPESLPEALESLDTGGLGRVFEFRTR
jgi:hypothetical protein